MANIKSQIKRNLQNEKAHERNKAVRSELKTRVKQAESAATEGEGVDEALTAAISRIDSAVSKGVLHKNTAARRKSRLVKRVAGIQSDSNA